VNKAMERVQSLVKKPLLIPQVMGGVLYETRTSGAASSSDAVFNPNTGKMETISGAGDYERFTPDPSVPDGVKWYKKLSSVPTFKRGVYYKKITSPALDYQLIQSSADLQTAYSAGQLYQLQTVYKPMNTDPDSLGISPDNSSPFYQVFKTGDSRDGITRVTSVEGQTSQTKAVKKYPYSATNGDDTALFNVEYNILSDTPPGLYDVPVIGDVARGVESIFVTPAFFTVTINENGFNQYLNQVRDAVNKVSFLYLIGSGYTELELYSAFDIAEVDQNSSQRSDGDKDRKKFSSSISKFQDKQINGIQQISDSVFGVAKSVNDTESARVNYLIEGFPKIFGDQQPSQDPFT